MFRKEIITILVVPMLCGIHPVRATVWTSGHHEIVNGEVYGEIWMYNDTTASMLGGDIYKMETFDVTSFDMAAGELDRLYVHDSSLANIRGGTLYTLEATNNSLVYIYAYDVTYDPTGGGYGKGWLEGKYIIDNSTFGFSLLTQDTYSHITVIPEPSAILLFGLGCLFIRKWECQSA